MKKDKVLAMIFATLVILFFIPSISLVSKSMIRLWSFSIVAYWIILTIIAIVLAFKVVKGEI